MRYWYDVCNDFTLDLRDTPPTSAELEDLLTEDCELGTLFAHDFLDEGPIYLSSDISHLHGVNLYF